MSSKRKRTFTEEFKRDAVPLIHREGYSLKEAASRLSIHESVLGKWKRRIEKEINPLRVELNSAATDSAAEIRQLREENRRLKMESECRTRAILKKAAARAGYAGDYEGRFGGIGTNNGRQSQTPSGWPDPPFRACGARSRSQYASYSYQELLGQYQMIPSMSGNGNCYDNAVCERFFRSLKHEYTEYKLYLTRQQARMDVIHYIEGFYNSKRPGGAPLHSTLGYKSPLMFEVHQAAKAA